MKHLISTSFFLLISISIVFAQPKAMGTDDPDAKKILDAVSTKFKTFKTVQANFTLSIASGTGKVLGTKKGMVYMKGVGYRISMEGQDVFSDGINVYTYDKSAKEITITKFDPTANTMTPQKIFTDSYDKDFLYKLKQNPISKYCYTLIKKLKRSRLLKYLKRQEISTRIPYQI
jgi:outer membrane lipoprotein carrier protein